MAENELFGLFKKLTLGLVAGCVGLIFGYIFGILFGDIGIVESIHWEPIFSFFGGILGFFFGISIKT